MAEDEVNWSAVVGRSLAFLCLHYAEMREATLVDQAQFLERLGLPRKEAAALIGTSAESVRVQLAKAKKKTASSNGGSRGRKRQG